jgi:hypothetical protein
VTDRAATDQRSAADLCREAIQLLDAATRMPPTELKAEVDVAERTIASLRDALIMRVRSGGDPDTRSALDKVNVALTLVVGLEYPLGGLQRTMLEQARATLNDALEASWS